MIGRRSPSGKRRGAGPRVMRDRRRCCLARPGGRVIGPPAVCLTPASLRFLLRLPHQLTQPVREAAALDVGPARLAVDVVRIAGAPAIVPAIVPAITPADDAPVITVIAPVDAPTLHVVATRVAVPIETPVAVPARNASVAQPATLVSWGARPRAALLHPHRATRGIPAARTPVLALSRCREGMESDDNREQRNGPTDSARHVILLS